MRKLILITIISLAAMNPVRADWIPDFLQSDLELFCQSCEEVLIDRLKSPSSYNRLECTGLYQDKEISEEVYLNYEYRNKSGQPTETDRLIFGYSKWTLSQAYLNYEAANSYGAQIRGTEICETMHTENKSIIDAIKILGPRVGGYTFIEWSSKQTDELTKQLRDQLEGN